MGKENGGSGTVARAALAEAVARRTGQPRNVSAAIIEMALDEMASALARGQAVKLASFGVFEVRSKGERIGRNPKTGDAAPITARRVVTFRPSNILKSRVNGSAVGHQPNGDSPSPITDGEHRHTASSRNKS